MTAVTLDKLISRADQLLQEAEAVVAGAPRTSELVMGARMAGFRSGTLSFLASTFGEDHIFYTDFRSRGSDTSFHELRSAIGILKAARDELAGGWLTTTRGLISGEIFADFLDMAEHLLEEDYKDAAAVIAGSVLEEHLRQLCEKSGIAIKDSRGERQIPRKADTLNAELAKSGAYNKLDQKEVTFWQGLRNSAAHGHYEEYGKEQVALMLQGISSFMARVPV